MRARRNPIPRRPSSYLWSHPSRGCACPFHAADKQTHQDRMFSPSSGRSLRPIPAPDCLVPVRPRTLWTDPNHDALGASVLSVFVARLQSARPDMCIYSHPCGTRQTRILGGGERSVAEQPSLFPCFIAESKVFCVSGVIWACSRLLRCSPGASQLAFVASVERARARFGDADEGAEGPGVGCRRGGDSPCARQFHRAEPPIHSAFRPFVASHNLAESAMHRICTHRTRAFRPTLCSFHGISAMGSTKQTREKTPGGKIIANFARHTGAARLAQSGCRIRPEPYAPLRPPWLTPLASLKRGGGVIFCGTELRAHSRIRALSANTDYRSESSKKLELLG